MPGKDQASRQFAVVEGDNRPADSSADSGPLRLGEILVRAGVVDERTIESLLTAQQTEGSDRLGTLLINRGVCTQEQIREALHEQMNIEVIDLDELEAPAPEIANLLPLDFVRRYEVLPLKREKTRLWVAMLDPYNLAAIDDIRFMTGLPEITVVTCVEADFKRYIRDHLDTTSLIDEIMEGEQFYRRAVEHVGSAPVDIKLIKQEQHAEESLHELKLASNQSPIITLTDFVLVEAIRQGASDIHIEPQETFFRIRLRVDGRLRTLMTPPKRLELPVATRFKVISEMDIANRRIPQDGHLAVRYSETKVHFRVSTLPTKYGEKCVLRVLKKESQLSSIDQVGMSSQDLGRYKEALDTPQGLVLLTGPTGSGKTTTVHAGLHYLNNGEINIVTLEDPVELTVPGVNHVTVNRRGGMTFGGGLRSILRQDPDVIFVGEMRDPEVTQIAMRASLTGHLVLSTLHTNNAVESLVRLDDMGTAPYLVAGALLQVIAQRLVRRVCDACAEQYMPEQAEIETFGLEPDQVRDAIFRRGTGCKRCADTGYFGRRGVFEVLRVTSDIRALIRRQANAEEIFKAARDRGMRTLFEAALEQALAGRTSLEEVNRVTYSVD